MTDAELVQAARQGCPASREQLARRWSRCALAFCLSRVRRADPAEDLAQESLIRALQHLDALEDVHKFGPWLRGICIRVCQDWQRRRSREDRALEQVSENGREKSPLQTLTEFEDRERLRQALETLPEEQREVIWLHYFERRSYDEMAQLLDVARSTVNSRLAAARRSLLQTLSVSVENSP